MPGATLREATCAGSGPGAHPSPRAPTRPRYPIWSCPHHGSSPVRGPALVTARDRRPRGTLTCPRADVPTTALRSLDPNSHEDDLRTSQLPSGTRPPDAAGPRPHPPRGALHLQAPPRVARALPPRRRLRPVRLPPLGAVGARGRLTPAGSPVRPFRVVRRSRHVYAGPVDSPSGPRAAGSRALVVGAGVGGLAAALSLDRAGWQVLVCERAPARRTGGYFVRLAPSGLDAASRLGVDGVLHTRLPADGVITGVDGRGRTVSRVDASLSDDGVSLALVRSDLERALWAALPDAVEVRFSTGPLAIHQGARAERWGGAGSPPRRASRRCDRRARHLGARPPARRRPGARRGPPGPPLLPPGQPHGRRPACDRDARRLRRARRAAAAHRRSDRRPPAPAASVAPRAWTPRCAPDRGTRVPLRGGVTVPGGRRDRHVTGPVATLTARGRCRRRKGSRFS